MANLPEVVKDLVRVLQLKSRSGQSLNIKFSSSPQSLTSLSKSSETSGSFKEPGLGGTGIALLDTHD